MYKKTFISYIFYLFLACSFSPAAMAQMTLVMPDYPTREKDPKDTLQQMDVLIALIDPFNYKAYAMEMPQRLAVIRALPPDTTEQPAPEGATAPPNPPDYVTKGEELLGEIEEIRYLGVKSWATHVSLKQAGLYHLLTETRPRWDEERKMYEQQFVKTILPVYGVEHGWDASAGLSFEIIPTTRPFGLFAPALFSGKVVHNGAPLANAPVVAKRLNTNKRGVPTSWHTAHPMRTNKEGEFSFVCPQPGWWGFMATAEGMPLKGPDTKPSPLELGAILWVYVDDANLAVYKPLPAKK